MMDIKAAWDEVNENLTGAELWWSRLYEIYNSQDRYYHNMALLERKLILLQEIGGAKNHQALILALFFQYFEYDPRNGDSADKNLTLFKDYAADVGLHSDVITEVELLLAVDGNGPDRVLLQDLDMAALAVPSEQYEQLVKQLRKEYDFLSDEAYKSLRKKILQSFLLIPNIFSTDVFRERFETQARSNIEGEIANMGSS